MNDKRRRLFRTTAGVILVGCLAGCGTQAAPIVTESTASTPTEPAPVPWEHHDTSTSCDGVVTTDEYGHYGWSYDDASAQWVRDDEPTIEQALSSLAPLTPEQRAELGCD